MKNRNVHSLCLVLRQEVPSSSSSAPLPSNVESTSSAECARPMGLSSRANSYPPQAAAASANLPSSHVVSTDSLSLYFTLRSKSAIFKSGAITPITPDFSPAARGDHHGQNYPGQETEVNGKQGMQVQSSRHSPLGCGTPISLDEEKSPSSWQTISVVTQATQQAVPKHESRTYASLSNLPTPPPSDSPLSPVSFSEASDEDLQDPDVLGRFSPYHIYPG